MYGMKQIYYIMYYVYNISPKMFGKLFLRITDYLKDRSQRVILDGSMSEWVPVTTGVPQPSLLGPLIL